MKFASLLHDPAFRAAAAKPTGFRVEGVSNLFSGSHLPENTVPGFLLSAERMLANLPPQPQKLIAVEQVPPGVPPSPRMSLGGINLLMHAAVDVDDVLKDYPGCEVFPHLAPFRDMRRSMALDATTDLAASADRLNDAFDDLREHLHSDAGHRRMKTWMGRLATPALRAEGFCEALFERHPSLRVGVLRLGFEARHLAARAITDGDDDLHRSFRKLLKTLVHDHPSCVACMWRLEQLPGPSADLRYHLVLFTDGFDGGQLAHAVGDCWQHLLTGGRGMFDIPRDTATGKDASFSWHMEHPQVESTPDEVLWLRKGDRDPDTGLAVEETRWHDVRGVTDEAFDRNRNMVKACTGAILGDWAGLLEDQSLRPCPVAVLSSFAMINAFLRPALPKGARDVGMWISKPRDSRRPRTCPKLAPVFEIAD